jgi:hypothetical protein
MSTTVAYVVAGMCFVMFVFSVRWALKEVIQAAVHDELENDIYVIRNELKYCRDMLEAQSERQYPPKEA